MNKYENFVADSGFFTGVSEDIADKIAAILQKNLMDPVIVSIPVPQDKFDKWLDAYPQYMADLCLEFEGSNAHDRAVSQLLEKSHSRVGQIFVDFQEISGWDRASRINPKALYESLRENDLLVERIVASAPETMLEALYNAPIPANSIVVGSSNGNVYADKETGKVLMLSEDWRNIDPGVAIPLKFDFAEYQSFWNEALPGNIDILDLGFASSDGECVEPAMDWRLEVKKEMMESEGPK